MPARLPLDLGLELRVWKIASALLAFGWRRRWGWVHLCGAQLIRGNVIDTRINKKLAKIEESAISRSSLFGCVLKVTLISLISFLARLTAAK